MPKPTLRTQYWVGALLVLTSAFCFAMKGIFIKLAYQYHIDTISLLTLRMLFSAPIYAVIALQDGLRPTTKSFPVRQLWRIATLGITGYYLASFLNFEGLNYITANLERILIFIYPTFVLLISVIRYGRKITKLQYAALALTYLGIALAFVENIDASQQKNIVLGAFWVILSGLVYAFYLVGSGAVIPRVGPLRFTCFAMLFATVPTVLHCAVANNLRIWHYPAEVYWISLAMAIGSTVIPTFMISEGVKRVGSSNASIIASIGPIFTIFLATSVLGETISALQVAGTVLVLIGVFLVGWKGEAI